MSKEKPRREAGEQTRRKLLDVGRRAFARKGHAGTNLREDILVPAGVSVGSFYHQFRDKTDLFLEILRQHSESFLATVQRTHAPAQPEETPGDLARVSYATCFRIAEENEDIFHIMLRERETDDGRVRDYLHENRRRWIASLAADYRRLMGSADRQTTEIAAELISSLTLGTLVAYLELPPDQRATRRSALIEGLVQFTVGGLPGLLSTPPIRRAAANRSAAKPQPRTTREQQKTGGH